MVPVAQAGVTPWYSIEIAVSLHDQTELAVGRGDRLARGQLGARNEHVRCPPQCDTGRGVDGQGAAVGEDERGSRVARGVRGP